METDLAYNMARYYASGIGRYVQSDRIGIKGGLNTYTYTANRPLRYTDPSGNFTVPEIIVVAAAVAVGIAIYVQQQSKKPKDNSSAIPGFPSDPTPFPLPIPLVPDKSGGGDSGTQRLPCKLIAEADLSQEYEDPTRPSGRGVLRLCTYECKPTCPGEPPKQFSKAVPGGPAGYGGCPGTWLDPG